MSNYKIKLNIAGLRELRTSPEMVNLLEEKVSAIASRCGDGYNYDTHIVRGNSPRAVASVYTDSKDAFYREKKNKTLLKELHE